MNLINNTQICSLKCVKRLLGFTLSEVLLTLTILGVVIGLTIPALFNNVQQSQFNSGVQVADKMLSQAVEQLMINNGIVNVASSNGLRNDLCNVMQCVKTDTTANLLSPISNPFYYSTYKGSARIAYNYATYPNAATILSNGMYLLVIYTLGSCAGNYGVNACGGMYVDINGPNQGPNMWGEDVYEFYVVLNNGVYSILPSGSSNDTNASNCQVGSSPGCTYQRLYNPNGMP